MVTNLDHDATLDVLLDGGHRKEDEEACGEDEDKADLVIAEGCLRGQTTLALV